METNVNYTAVGVFVILLVTLIVLAVIWLASGFSMKTYTFYKVYMSEPVSGITLESPVEFNGVEVGRVNKIKIDRTNPQIVIIVLKIQSSTPVTNGTVAKLSMRGITGQTYIGLLDKGDDRRPLLPQKNQRYAVIKTTPSLLIKLETTLNKISEGFDKMSQSISALLNPENQRLFKSILKNTNIASEELTPLLLQAKHSMRLLEKKTLPNVNNAFSNFGNLSRDLGQVSGNLYDISRDIKQNPAVLIRGKAERRLGPGER